MAGGVVAGTRSGPLRRLLLRLDEAEGSGAGDRGSPYVGDARLYELDGMRGWAAFAVVVFHIFYETFGALFPAFRNPLMRATNGTLAVYVFFVLSGEALSTSFFAGGGTRAIASLAVKRYSRLTIPIVATIAAVLMLQRAQLMYAQQAAPIVHRDEWLGQFEAAPTAFGEAAKYAFLRVYTTAEPAQHILPFLWTMAAEMWGSIFVFAILGSWGALRRPRLLLVVGIILCEALWSTAFIACFACGVLYSAMRAKGVFARAQQSAKVRAAAWLAIVVAFIIAAMTSTLELRLQALAAMMLIGGVHAVPMLTRAFRSSLSRLLGKLSFPLYLVQYPVLVSLTCWLIVRSAARGPLDPLVATEIGLASLAVAVAAAVAFEPVEILTKRIGHRLAEIFVKERPRADQRERSE